MNKLLPALLLSTVLLGAAPAIPAQAANDAQSPAILLDGVPLAFPVAPRIIEGRTMVPFRAIAEALGVEVTWRQEDQSVDAVGPETQVRLAIGNNIMWVNGEARTLDVAPMIVEDRTLIPLRAFSTAFHAEVDWNAANYTVTIQSPVRPMRTLAFYALQSYGERHYVPRFSDVAYGWATLLPDGTLDTTTKEYRWPEPDGEVTGEVLLAEAARAGTKRHLMVQATDRDGGLTALVLDAARRERAAEQIAALVQEKAFDGVVLDLEGLGLEEVGLDLQLLRMGFVQLAEAVESRLHPAGKEVIVAAHPPNGAYRAYDYAALLPHVDLLQIMAYDYAQDGNPEPVDRVIEAIEMSLSEVGAADLNSPLRQKLMLGMVAAYETPETIQQKAGLAKRYGLGGIFVWRLGQLGPEDMAALEATVSPLR
ncbi:MAG TPA: stalk domain-containing protein [Symbiobacteriaceae bacterium]|nr:stalk domain-containing protein [Symbiobacteriaceae bacterium]